MVMLDTSSDVAHTDLKDIVSFSENVTNLNETNVTRNAYLTS